MRVSQAPRHRRRRAVAAAIAVAVAGFGLGVLAAELLWSGTAGDSVAAPAPLDRPTPTASATPSAGTAAPAPVATPSAVFDMEAHSLTDPDSIWVVVNKRRPLSPETYAPADLVTVDGAPADVRLRADAAAAMGALQAAADDADAGFAVSTAYRDRAFQAALYDGYVARSGRDGADRYSARPGFSEHQTGLAADVRADGCDLEACFADTAAGRYLAEHAWEHGFIVRYAEGAESVTGYIYEPWHLRFVGVELATEMRARGVATMEEFFGLEAAPDYA